MKEAEYGEPDWAPMCPYCYYVVDQETLEWAEEDGDTNDYECDSCGKPFRAKVVFYDPAYETKKVN